MRTLLALSLAFLLALSLAAPAVARGKAPSTAPGKYSEWNGEIDELEIVSPFKLADYTRIVVEPFDTSATPLPDAKENTYEPVKNVLANVTPPFVAGLREDLARPPAEVGKSGGAPGDKTLVVRAKVLEMDPGSKAARYWGGFGAGAVRVQLAAEVLDGGTDKILFRYTQERRSGWGAFGGDYEKLLNKTLGQLGGDLAGILEHF